MFCLETVQLGHLIVTLTKNKYFLTLCYLDDLDHV